MRLARYISTSPAIWMRQQAQYDLEQADRAFGKDIIANVPELATKG